MDDHLIGILSNIGVISFVALSAYLLLLTGEISFGQQAFFAIGAYTAGIVTAMWQLPFALGLGAGAAAGAAAALLVGLPTLRLHGLQFAIATLAFAEAVRILFELFRLSGRAGRRTGRTERHRGFSQHPLYLRERRQRDAVHADHLRIARRDAVGFFLLERSRLGTAFRMIGEDDVLAAMNGVPVIRAKLIAACLAGAIAGLGGGLYAHLTTYVEPAIFDVMLGVHSLAYGLIGGLGTAFGPLLGVVIDIGLLEFDALVCRLSHDRVRRAGGGAPDRAPARAARRAAGAPDPAHVRPPAIADARKRHCSRKGTAMIAARAFAAVACLS